MKLVFTDLDGTFLDHNTYSYEKSLIGFNLLKENNIPLILISSKTCEEMTVLHKELSLGTPFIFENGGGIAVPENGRSKISKIYNGSLVEDLLPKTTIVEKLLATKITTLIDMTISEVSEKTGLSIEKAKMAKQRETSIPFIIENGDQFNIDHLQSFNKTLSTEGLFLTKGGRFYHITSQGANKGIALKKVVDLYKKKNGITSIISAAIGDSENDVPMLAEVDKPFLVRKHDGSAIETGLKNITVTSLPGPEGFSEAMNIFINF